MFGLVNSAISAGVDPPSAIFYSAAVATSSAFCTSALNPYPLGFKLFTFIACFPRGDLDKSLLGEGEGEWHKVGSKKMASINCLLRAMGHLLPSEPSWGRDSKGGGTTNVGWVHSLRVP